MSKRKKPPTTIIAEYYNRAFLLLNQQLAREGYSVQKPHEIRQRYWGLVPPGEYSPLESRPMLLSYLKIVEEHLATIVREHSIAYWLHLYRRLAPESVGSNKQPTTVGLVRATMEAAIQKYAALSPCSKVGISTNVPLESILGGLLAAPEFGPERDAVQTNAQLVLTDFTVVDLRAFYDVEKLAYEIWRASAMLRITGKGASILVTANDVVDTRSDELAKLITVYDARHREASVSAKGVIFDADLEAPEASGTIFMPTYNLTRVSTDEFEPLFTKVFKLELMFPVAFNFLWIPFHIRAFRDGHEPFSNAFREERGVALNSALAVIVALCYRAFRMWFDDGIKSIYRHWQRAYEGPSLREEIIAEIRFLIPQAASVLGLKDHNIEQQEIRKAFRFWELTEEDRQGIDLAYPGPHAVFLPFDRDRVFVDYAWIGRRLYDFFLGINIPDQNFKGDALEKSVRFLKTALPVGPCTSISGEQRQIDASYALDKRLVIVECKAVGKSIAFDRGEPEAIRYRNRLVEDMLQQVDSKALWLRDNPVGTNYDIREYSEILPIAVSPFVEYIPSLNSHFWLDDDLPRVLTPGELRDALKSKRLSKSSLNIVPLERAYSSG